MTNYHHNKRVAAEIIKREANPTPVETALPAGRSLGSRVDSPPAAGFGAAFGGGASHVPKVAFDCSYVIIYITHSSLLPQ